MASVGDGLAIGTSTATAYGATTALNFFFAWVDRTDTVWSTAFAREDEQVYGFALSHQEGSFATLEISVYRNTPQGLLAPSRKQWMWLAYSNGATIVPLFFGRIVGVPREMGGELMRLEFIARPANWYRLKSALAQSLRTLPFYDPIWIAQDKRAEADVVLEARPERWHIDRVTHAVTTSNILQGEDGTLAIGGDFFYDTLRMTYEQPASRRVTVQAQVTWQQRASGVLDLTWPILMANWGYGTLATSPWLMSSFTGEGLIKDWPKAGQNIGAGWKFGNCMPLDRTGISMNVFLDIWTQDGNQSTFPLWGFIPYVTVEYEADRARIERIIFTLEADMQSLVSEPADEEIVMLSLSSADVAAPVDALITPPNWEALTEYGANDFIVSNGATYRCIRAGTSGVVAPNDVSASIVDGTCIWSWTSYETQVDLQMFAAPWTPSTDYEIGDYVQNGGLVYQCVDAGTSSASGGPQGFKSLPWAPDNFYYSGDMVTQNGLYFVAMNDGRSGAQGPMPLVVSWDGGIQWAWIASPATNGGTITDGTCKWVWFNSGLPIGDFGRRQYFTTDRGKQSVEYLIALARARIMARSRAVTIEAEIPFNDGIELSLRKSASITDDRIPGGVASGKVIGYTLSMDGGSGEAKCAISIGATVGTGGTASQVAGSPVYVATGYVSPGYQQEEGGSVFPTDLDDITYEQFEATPTSDDGIDFTAFGPYDAIEQLEVINGEIFQANAITYIGEHFKGFIDIQSVLEKYPTMVDLYLKPVAGGVRFQTDYALVLSKLQIPRMIDLEAEV